MVHEDRRGRHTFTPAGVVGLLMAGMVCGVFWREIAHAVLRLT
jgi:hypothetical protein